MTATRTRPHERAAPARPTRPTLNSGARRTLLALAGSALGIVPLKGLFSDTAWLVDAWFSMIVVIAPAFLLRLRRAPGAMDIWAGIVLLAPWLTLRYLGDTAVAGVIPTSATWTKLSQLMTELHEITREEVAPIHTSVPVRLVLCALVGLFAALVDLIAVVGRRGALSGIPLMVVFTVSGAVPRSPVAWPWFVAAAIGFLILLTLNAGDEHARWGRRIRASENRSSALPGRAARTTLAITAPRIAVVAVIAALILPLLVPGQPRNLLANAFHGGGGLGGGSGGQISPFADLKGKLDLSNPRTLAEVQMLGRSDVNPYYLRTDVLSDYTGQGWQAQSHGERTSIGDDQFPVDASGSPDTVELGARITVDGLRGDPGVFNYPVSISGLDDSTGWSPQDQLLLGPSPSDGSQYTVRFRQPDPTPAQLAAASSEIDPSVRSQLELSRDIPDAVRAVVRDQIAGTQSQYAKARALNDYFSPKNGFTYSLATKASDSGSALVDFLRTKQGFCQQYAAALAVMLRVAGVPARVVLGYSNSGPDRDGRFAVSTLDAHAWVEAWFAGIGWVPFDPTPASGLPGGGASLPWAPRDTGQGSSPTSTPTSSAPRSSAPVVSSSAAPTTSAGAPVAAEPAAASVSLTGWLVALAVVIALALAFTPALIRAGRRRRRYRAARAHGDTEALWRELSDTALDLGFVWSQSRSPRQVALWLAADAPAGASTLQVLAAAVERRRYAGNGAGTDAPGDALPTEAALDAVAGELRATRSARTRLRARFWPASLGWTSPFGPSGRHEL